MPWDEKLPSDADVEGMNEQELDHRLNILWDLEDSFSDNAWQSVVWGGLAVVFVCAGSFFDWIDDDKVVQTLAIASIIFIACAGIWGHSLYWRNRFKRRRKFLLRRMKREYGSE